MAAAQHPSLPLPSDRGADFAFEYSNWEEGSSIDETVFS